MNVLKKLRRQLKLKLAASVLDKHLGQKENTGNLNRPRIFSASLLYIPRWENQDLQKDLFDKRWMMSLTKNSEPAF